MNPESPGNSKQQPVVVGGRYELGELLGRGGMAEVRKGTDTRLGRVVAVKRLRTDLASDATFQARFRREAQSSASLNHPAIVAVYDTGEEVIRDGEGHEVRQPYIVMEYVAGRTLRDILREGRKILPERALEITSGVLSALDYSHRAGIIHRDIKPGNVMLTPSGDVKVMDFGIARAISDAQSTMTQTAAVVGTAQYLSPEQARGEQVDSRSDVYSAGCLFYELLTGRPPFVGDSPVAVAYQHVREQPQPPSQHDSTLPAALDAIALKALAKRVEDRYQSAAEMRADIERYLDGQPITTVAPPVVAGPATAATQVVAPIAATSVTSSGPIPFAAEDDYDESRGRTGLLIGLAVLVVALVIGGILLWPKLFPGAPEQVQVPQLVGLTENQARAAIGDAGLSVNVDSYENSDTVPTNSVIRQDPVQGSYVDPHSSVSIILSKGKPQVTVPSVVGQDVDEATSNLEALGLTVKTQEVDSDDPKGQVTEAAPAAGQMVNDGTEITLSVSKGPKRIPNVVGMTQAEAEQAIRDQGFVPQVQTESTSQKPAGTVSYQFPAAGKGKTAKQGEQILIQVSTYTPTPTTQETFPTPSGCITPTPGVELQPGDPPACSQ
ncbi:Stk1 family PASTA domain-containing Ser/Thr kinase [Nocardioides sp. Kera G14]|uniref:Stk1 family PASTA domain-containing Ser/Thr kinase n=1 Tax=Nocardioides sp. Kera G14 TaxID=2884264 RepID=UPI001D0FA22E|nr:Stk1 family PASTA domain-containing Ser/Thr kinase [Nocardioides sp. Kera G14]UDY23628.1 Stk1 family PASTA domain-containing Ser/Thr kinase [Nocardioides sp. Kera G14]